MRRLMHTTLLLDVNVVILFLCITQRSDGDSSCKILDSFWHKMKISSIIQHANANAHIYIASLRFLWIYCAWGGSPHQRSITWKFNLFLRSEGICAGQDLGASKLGSSGSTCDV